jgi:membrane fusion protein (multidrug efflux system)
MNAQTQLDTPAVEPVAATPAATLRKRLVLAGVALAAAGYFGHAWWFNANFVETDNAQVDGHIIPVASKLGGFIAAIPVRDNQAVKAGDVLVQMDDRDYHSRLAQADAELAQALASSGNGKLAGQASAQLGAASAQAEAAQADIAQAEADYERSRREAERLQSLLGKKLVSPQQYDSAEAAARSARARLTAAREAARAATQQVSAAGAALRGADARFLAVRAARDIAAHQLADTRIVAAVDGVISRENVEAGQLVQMGQPLLNLVPVHDLWITANLKETQIRDLGAGNEVLVKIDAYPGLEWKGKVESFAPATGAKFTLLPPDNATGNFTRIVQRIPVKVRLEAGQHPDRMLRPGMNATVRISKSR